MKYRKLLPIVLIFSLILTSCSNFSKIEKNKLMIDNLEENKNISSEFNKKTILSDEEAKIKALEALEKYFNIKLYLSEIACYARFSDANSIKKELSNNAFKNFKNNKSVLENGTYDIAFIMRKSKNEEQNNYLNYFIRLDARTGELLEYNNCTYDGNDDTNSNMDINEAEKFAKEFIIKSNINNTDNEKNSYKITSKMKKFNMYHFVFEDVKNLKVEIRVDGKKKNIHGFLIYK